MANYVTPQPEYDVPARRIAGSQAEKLEQIDAAIQELLDIKLLECASVQPNIRFLAVPRRSHWAGMTIVLLVLLLLLVLVVGVHPARAQDPAAPPAAEWRAGGFLDVGYLADTNSPANHLFRSRGTTRRVDELDLDMAAAYVRKPAAALSRWGVELTAQGGRDAEIFGFSPTAPNLAGGDVLRYLGPTNVSYLFPAGRGLTIQGGIFSSFVGYDSLYAKDNFSYTRPWAADFTPYLMLGVNATYPVSDRLGIAGFAINGYFHLAHANDAPTIGGQASYALSGRTSLKETALFGSHQPDTSFGHWRVLSDTIVEHRAGRLTAAGELQLAAERVGPSDTRASWISAQLPVHVVLVGPWSGTVRPEFARDLAGRYTGFRQQVQAITSTLEYRHAARDVQAIFRLEHRYDHSSGPEGGFFTDGTNGDAPLTPGQTLVAAAFILTFDRTWKVTP